MVVDDNEEENEIVMDEPKWNVGDHVVVEDSRVGASRKLFWEVLAVVKSREYVSGEWHYCVDDLDYETGRLSTLMDDLVLGMLLIVRCCSAPSSYFIYQHTSL